MGDRASVRIRASDRIHYDQTVYMTREEALKLIEQNDNADGWRERQDVAEEVWELIDPTNIDFADGLEDVEIEIEDEDVDEE